MHPVPAPRASVIVPALNAEATLGATLAGLAAQDLAEDFEVIVVDNGSTDGTAALAEGASLPVRILRKDPGPAGSARNLGAANAVGEILAFTDADCRPTPGWLREGLAAMGAADLVQGAVRPFHEVAPQPFDRTLWVTDDHGLFETASLFVHRGVFERVGGFEDWSTGTDMAVPFGEDTWFGWRAKRAGASVRFAERAVVEHAVFRRSAADYIRERRRAAAFPALVERMPELRKRFLHRRWFLSERSLRFDLAAVALAAALAWRAPWPLLGAVPYLLAIARSASRWGRGGPRAALGEAAADAQTLASLASGSLRHRTPVL